MDLGEIARRVQAKLGADVELMVEVVERLPLTQRGKHGFLVQEMDSPRRHGGREGERA